MRFLARHKHGHLELTKNWSDGTEKLPRYAILSHTWLQNNEDEVTYEDMMHTPIEIAKMKGDGYQKIRFCADQAAQDGLEYCWVDTCCIDKRNAVELSESLNSMFRWYRNAVTCYVYLKDVKATRTSEGGSWIEQFKSSMWFKRGWTLQELLAPMSVEFFSSTGVKLGDKKTLEREIHEVTEIPIGALRGDRLSGFSVAERLSWAKNRETKRPEDQAYCLLGMFDVFMAPIYGENEHAFERLQHKIEQKHAENDRLEAYLDSLPIASDAAFNSRRNQHDPTCLPETRRDLLQTIADWADGSDDKCIFWLNGIAGTGKSTVARTVARKHHVRGNLGASFFFSKGGGDLGNANSLMTTLARQMASRIPSLRRHICEAIMKQKDIIGHSIRDQWEHLILQPMSKVDPVEIPTNIVLVVDALDECDSERDIEVVLRVLSTARSLTRTRLRIFITSRPLTPIRQGFKRIPDTERNVFALHEISLALINKDLEIFFEDNFSAIREERNYEDGWPGARTIKRLVEISCGLFIWASTACRYIREGKRFVRKRIEKLMNGHRAGVGPEAQLDQIYTTVLKESLGQGFNPTEKEELYEILREILGTIVTLYSPLSMEALARLLGIDVTDISETLSDLHPIFHVPSGPIQTSYPIRLHHPTFRDFLLDKQRCVDLDFWVDAKATHEHLANCCIEVMNKGLRRDICGLEKPGTLIQDVDPTVIARSIPPELKYACLYWVHHIRESRMALKDGDKVHRFFERSYLFWLEAMCLMGKTAEMGAIIRLYHSLLEPKANPRQMDFVKDSRRFIFALQSIIRSAPLQTYASALVFIPPTNQLQRHFRHELHPWIVDFKIAEAVIPKAKDEFNYVNDLAFTPDSSKVASGSQLLAAKLWDVQSRSLVREFGGFEDKVSSVSISSDGKLFACGSDDFKIRIYDLQTGRELHYIDAHTRWVNSVVFSPDGTILASGSMDESVALWKVTTGREVKRFANQGSGVNSTAFSPDGSFIVTGSVDQMIRMWIVSGDPKDLPMILDGHSGPVNCVRFSHEGNRIVSGADDMTLKIWDTLAATSLMTLKGHTKKIMAVAFSPDSRFIASGGEDRTIRIWDANSGTPLHVISDVTSGINAVVFSPNGNLLASGYFDDNVRLWDTKSWATKGSLDDFRRAIDGSSVLFHHSDTPESGDTSQRVNHELQTVASTELQGHSGQVNCLVVSPNGLSLASGAQDASIKLWAREGLQSWRLEGHSDSITDLDFAPHSKLLASASADATVKVWTVGSGELVRTLRCHSQGVKKVRFSHDGGTLASCSMDTRVALYDAVAEHDLGRLEGHSAAINDIEFSPDSKTLVSCSEDGSVRLWEIATLTQQCVLTGHSGPVRSVSFASNGAYFVSCSADSTIKIWSIDGAMMGILKAKKDQQLWYAAISSQGDQLVVSSSSDRTVSLWNRATSDVSNSISTNVDIRRISIANRGGDIDTDRGRLKLSQSTSSSHEHTLFVTEEWVRRDESDALWLPEDYRATCVATTPNLVAMGHASGKLSFIYF